MLNHRKYTNSLFGIQLHYPEYWNLISAEEFYEQLNNIKTESKLFDENLAENAKKPLIALSRYSLDYHDINPTFKISINLFGNIKVKSLDEILIYVFQQFKGIFKNFRIRIEPKEVKLDNKIAWYGMAYYSLKSNLGIEFNICSEIWLVHRGAYFIMIAASTKHQDDTNIKDDIKKIIESLRITD
jgi:hypothetical protein